MANNNRDRDNQNSDKRDEPIIAVPAPLSSTGSGYMPAVLPVEGLVDEENTNATDAERVNQVGVGSDGRKPSDERIEREMNDHLAEHSYIDATEIVVTVKDSEVTLDGSVPDDDQKHYVEEVAQKVSGVTHVHNRLKIKNTQNPLVQNTTGKQ
jgi:hypothetical protein